jgi:putative transposase
MEPVRPQVRRGDPQEEGRPHAPAHHWRWRLDGVYVKINGEMHHLWRPLDHEGEVLESYASNTRDEAAALISIKKAMKRQGKP